MTIPNIATFDHGTYSSQEGNLLLRVQELQNATIRDSFSTRLNPHEVAQSHLYYWLHSGKLT